MSFRILKCTSLALGETGYDKYLVLILIKVVLAYILKSCIVELNIVALECSWNDVIVTCGGGGDFTQLSTNKNSRLPLPVMPVESSRHDCRVCLFVPCIIVLSAS